jgi:hypothetical protein
MRWLIVALLGSALGLGACASSHALRAAKEGDYSSLKAELQRRHQTGSISNSEAADIAKAVAEREIRTARDKKEALARLRDAQSCAGELDDALADRMRVRDEVGAEAALVRLDAGKLSTSDARAYLNDPDDRWRALGVRTLTEPEDRAARQKAMLDPSPHVRRAAMRAAAAARDAADLDVLLESARVDPEPWARTDALRAVMQLGPKKGAEIALRLRDLWTTADEPLREEIAVAWSMPPIWAGGGREALRVLVASEHGPGVLAGAGAILRNRERDDEVTRAAAALVVRSMASGTRRDKLHAIAIAQTSIPDLLDALRKAARDDDSAVRVPAMARLLESPPDRAEAIRMLEQFAGQKEYAYAPQARLVLARAQDARIQAWIEWDLDSTDPHRRLVAASALAALGRAARGALLLADADPAVRTRAACTLLLADRR